MGTFRQQDTGAATRLDLEGDFTIMHAEGLRDALQEALSGAEALELDLSRVEKVDVTFFQLVQAAQKSAEAMDKKITCVGEVPEGVFEEAQATGMLEVKGICNWRGE